MPIKRKNFYKAKFKSRFGDIETHPVTIFLRDNSSRGYTVEEITEYTAMNKNTVRGALTRLKKKGLIDHQQPYFIIKI